MVHDAIVMQLQRLMIVPDVCLPSGVRVTHTIEGGR